MKKDIWQMGMFAIKQYIGKHKYIICCETTVQTSFVRHADLMCAFLRFAMH